MGFGRYRFVDEVNWLNVQPPLVSCCSSYLSSPSTPSRLVDLVVGNWDHRVQPSEGVNPSLLLLFLDQVDPLRYILVCRVDQSCVLAHCC
jgi:hypothetical protein